MSDRVYVGLDIADFRNLKVGKPISKVTLMYDEENGFSAGDDSGLEVVAECYFATQAMADNALAILQGQKYQAFMADAAGLDPAAELGDAVTVSGIYAPLVRRTDSGYGFPDIEAPGEEELEEEDQSEGPLTREVKRKVTLGASYHGVEITRANGLEISWVKADGTVGGNRAVLNSKVFALYDDDGNEALYFDSVARKYRFVGDVHITGGTMNVNDNFIVDELGNVTINGNLNIARGSLYWGSNFPYVSQFSDSASGPWHTEQTTDDIYRRDSWDGGKTWGTPYQFVGKDGVDGSDARVPSYIKSTYIDETTIRSPVIEANEFNVYPNDEEDYTGSFNIYGMQLGSQYHMLAIAYQGYNGAVTPYVDVYSPDGADLRFNYGNQGVSPIQFYGTVDFSNATVSGLNNITATVEGIEGENPYIDGEEWVQIWAGDTVEVRADNDITLGAYRKENDSGKKTVNLALRMSREHERFHFYVNGVTWVLDEDGLWKL